MNRTRPKKSLGQNFLIDPNFQRKIIAAFEAGYAGGTVLEIGPGRGALTQHLVQRASHLILVEKDRLLAAALQSRFADQSHVTVVSGDFLAWELSALPASGTTVVANLPYNIASQILIRLFENNRRFARLLLMLQKEVGCRCTANPGSRDFGILSLWCQVFSRPRRLFDCPPGAFRPRPKVVSSLIEFVFTSGVVGAEQKPFIGFVKLIFSQRRKKISTILKGRGTGRTTPTGLAALTDQRAENLQIEEMRRLFEWWRSDPQDGV